ncbi:MAG TPA: ROK family protein [Acidimicrobiales bacterium]|jgi:polyphosphate glucokinase|nr:ROK family protein [Acidimicrobiales bacterium]
MSSESPIGVDIGGSGIKVATVDLVKGALAGDRVRVATPAPATPAAIAAVVASTVGSVGGTGTVGLTMPSVVVDGVVKTASNIDPSWIGTDAVALFEQATSRRVAVVNDADAAGMAEMRYGAGMGHDGVVVLITLGTGIGSAVFFKNVLVPNTELGHLRLHHRDAEEWAAESVREREKLSWTEWAHRLSSYLEHLERLLYPELFLIGGGVSGKSDKFVPLLTCETPIKVAQLHNDAGIVGAAMVAPVEAT